MHISDDHAVNGYGDLDLDYYGRPRFNPPEPRPPKGIGLKPAKRQSCDTEHTVARSTTQKHTDYAGEPRDTTPSRQSVCSALSAHDCVPLRSLCRTDAINGTIPAHKREYRRQLFELARILKSRHPDADPAQLRPLLKEWCQQCDRVINRPFDDVRADFYDAWGKVKYPIGEGPIDQLIQSAKTKPLPKIAEAYGSPETRLLVALCRDLQLHAGDGNHFYLSCRTAGRLVGVDHATAARWLRLLVAERVLKSVSKGSRVSKMASEFQYLGD